MPMAEFINMPQGAEACFVNSEKFKKSVFSVSLFVPMDKKYAAANSLLCGLLTRGTREYDSYTALNARLHELYGASINAYTSLLGDMQMIVFKAGCLSDRYTDGEHALYETARLICEMIFEPMIENGRFKDNDFESEKRLLCEDILAEMNDKRRYALMQLRKNMFSGEPYGLAARGDIDAARALTNEQTVGAYHNLINNAYIHINLVSSERHDDIFDMFRKKLEALPRDVEKKDITVRHIPSEEVREISEHMDVTQGKLCMGFSVDCGDNLYDAVTLRVLSDVFGGGTHSKLFDNVREKQSLCYYCSARAVREKSAILVDSGILNENREKAQSSILAELEAIKNGDVTEELLNISKNYIVDMINSGLDSVYSIDSWYSTGVYSYVGSADEYCKELLSVTLDDVLAMAQTVKLDTVYFLGKKEN